MLVECPPLAPFLRRGPAAAVRAAAGAAALLPAAPLLPPWRPIMHLPLPAVDPCCHRLPTSTAHRPTCLTAPDRALLCPNAVTPFGLRASIASDYARPVAEVHACLVAAAHVLCSFLITRPPQGAL